VQILLVEDDRELRRFLSKAFREEGYGVTETDTGDRGRGRPRGFGYEQLVAVAEGEAEWRAAG